MSSGVEGADDDARSRAGATATGRNGPGAPGPAAAASKPGPAPAADSAERFGHRALIYESEREFVEAALPFVREGVRGGEPVLVAAQRANVEGLREGLGGDAAAAELLAVEEWYESSARTRDKFARWVTENADGGRVRLIGEPPWPLASEAGIRDWARHEAVLNVAFAGLPVTFICPYDARVLPDGIIDHAESTHPEIHGPHDARPSARYEDPHDFCRRLDRDVDSRRGPPVARLELGRAALATVRRLVGAEASQAGLGSKRAEELMLAVDELATNALVHGARPAELRVWREPSELVFEIRDSGEGLADPLAGQFPPPVDQPGGRGLWLSRMMSDALEIHRATDGPCVRIHASLD